MSAKTAIYAKYFWDLNKKAINEAGKILNNPNHPQFMAKLITILSRCQEPKELFSLISKESFINNWPRVKAYWKKFDTSPDFWDWWQTIYEELVQRIKGEITTPKGEFPSLFVKFGKAVKKSRIAKSLSQKDLAFATGITQSDISLIEEGYKNITLKTLFKICKILKIEKI